MRWNWQQPDWPNFRFDAARLHSAEAQFLKGAGIVIGTLHHLDGETQRGFAIELISQEMVESSAIEGEVLDRASVQSSIAKQLGFAVSQRHANAAEAGAAELMADLYRSYAQPLTNRQLFDWHRMLMNGRRDINEVGAYRAQAGNRDSYVRRVCFGSPLRAQKTLSHREPKAELRRQHLFSR